MSISSTTEVLSSADTVLDANIVLVSIVILVSVVASIVLDNNNIAIGSCGLFVGVALMLMYGVLLLKLFDI